MNKCGMACNCKTRCPMRAIGLVMIASVLSLMVALLVGGCAVGRTANDEAVYGVVLGDDPDPAAVDNFANAAGGAANLIAPGSGGFVTEGIIAAAGALGIGGAAAAARSRGKKAEAKQTEADDAWDKWAETKAELEAAKARLTANVDAALRGGAK